MPSSKAVNRTTPIYFFELSFYNGLFRTIFVFFWFNLAHNTVMN